MADGKKDEAGKGAGSVPLSPPASKRIHGSRRSLSTLHASVLRAHASIWKGEYTPIWGLEA